MHRRCQEIIGAAIPRDFPSRPLCLGLLHNSDYNESQRSSLLRSFSVLFTDLYKASGSQEFIKHLVLSKI